MAEELVVRFSPELWLLACKDKLVPICALNTILLGVIVPIRVVLLWAIIVEENKTTLDLSMVVKSANEIAAFPVSEDQEGLAVGLDHLKGHVVLHRHG